MAEIASWNGHKFEVRSGYVQGFTDLTLKGSSETEDKDASNQKYVSRKNGNPIEISLTARLNALTGCTDVQGQALKFVTEARSGAKNYFYVNGKKLLTCQLMLTEATVKEIGMTSKGKWTRADIQLTLKQCTKNDGSVGGSDDDKDGKGKGSSSKTYKVQIPGMSVIEVKATSVQDAINKTMVKSWTGTVFVNGKSYYVVRGVITKNPNTDATVNGGGTDGTDILSAMNFLNVLLNAAKTASAAANAKAGTPTTTLLK